MTDQTPDYAAVIEQLRRLARGPFEVPEELRRLRHRIEREREKTHHQMVERLAKEARIDIQGFFDDARRRGAAKGRYVRQALEPLEARALAEARAQKEQFHKVALGVPGELRRRAAGGGGAPAAAQVSPALRLDLHRHPGRLQRDHRRHQSRCRDLGGRGRSGRQRRRGSLAVSLHLFGQRRL